MYRTLIDARTLAEHRHDSDWVTVDCRFQLSEPDAGEDAYRKAHIPGAVYAHLERDLSGPVTEQTGRHPLPDAELLAQKLGAWGIGPATQVVVYDAAGGALAAARLWWLLRWLGHYEVAVLDGGWAAWTGEGRPVTAAVPHPRPRRFIPRPDKTAWLGVQDVEGCVAGLAPERLLDARGTTRYTAEEEPIDAVAGHVPGARNLPFSGNLGTDGRFLPAQVLRERFAGALGKKSPAEVVHMCGSGVSACHNLLAMEYAGLHGSRLYVGSWSEWIRDPRRPVATGNH